MKTKSKLVITILTLCMMFGFINHITTIKASDTINDSAFIINDNEFRYYGNAGENRSWGKDKKESTLFHGDSHWSNIKHQPTDDSIYYEFVFTGTHIALYGNKENHFGIAKVLIDHVEEGRFDGYSATKQYQQKLWESRKLEDRTHTIKVILTAHKNPLSKGYNTLIDYAKVYQDNQVLNSFTLETKQTYQLPLALSSHSYTWKSEDSKIAKVENGIVTAISIGDTKITAMNKENNDIQSFHITVIPKLIDSQNDNQKYSEVIINDHIKGTKELQFNYHGNWGKDKNIAGLYYEDAHWSDVSLWQDNPRNHYYTMKFTGKKIEIYGSLQPRLGIYDVYIDNFFMGKIDAYGITDQPKQLYFASPILESKEHELKVVMTGQKNPKSTAPSGFVDYVKVTRNADKIYPIKISLDQMPKTLEQNMPITPKISYLPSNANQKPLSWIVDSNMIQVNNDGTLTPLKNGKTTLIATTKDFVGNRIESEPIEVTIIDGKFTGKVDFISKNRKIENEKYDEYAKLINKQSSMTLWKNDTSNQAAVLLTKELPVKAKIETTDFKNQNGDLLMKEQINANFEKYISTYAGSNYIPTRPRPFYPSKAPNGNRVNAADVIYGNEIEIPAYTAQPIWIKVTTLTDTKPGLYEGTIMISLNDKETLELKQTIEVLNLTIENSQDYYLNLWQYPYASSEYYHVTPFSEEHLAIMKKQMKPYMNAGGKTGTASIIDEPWYHQTYSDYPSMIKWYKNNGKWEFDYTDFDKWASFLLNDIKVSYIECYSIVPWENRLQYIEDGKVKIQNSAPGTPEWNDAWGHFLQDFTKHLDEKDWFDHIIIAMDERSPKEMNPALNLIDSIKNKNQHTFKVGGAVGSYNKEIWDRLFSVTPHIGNIHDKNIPFTKLRTLANERRKQGKLTSIYTMIHDYPGMFSLSDPAESAWTIWFAEYCGTDGFLRWAYDAWVENPLEDNAHAYFESGDMFFIYPGTYQGKETTPRTSPRFEMMNEAIKDIQKLRTIRSAGGEFEEKANQLLNSLTSFYGQGSSNHIGSAGFVSGNEKTKIALSNEVDRLHQELILLSKEFEKTNH